MQRKKPTYLQQRKPRDQVNTRLLVWAASGFTVLIMAMAVLLILNK